MAPPQHNPYTPPTSDIQIAEVEPETLVLASRMARFGGSFVDGMISMPMVFIFTSLHGGWQIFFRDYLPDPTHKVIYLASMLGFFWLIQGWFLYSRGQTIGKIAAKTRIVIHDSEETPNFPKILLRYASMQLTGFLGVFGSLLSLIDLLFIFGEQRRCVHDLIAGTRVVKVRS